MKTWSLLSGATLPLYSVQSCVGLEKRVFLPNRWCSGTATEDFLLHSTLGMLVEFCPQSGHVKCAGDRLSRQEGNKVDGNHRCAKQGLQKAEALGLGLADIGEAVEVTVSHPIRSNLLFAGGNFQLQGSGASKG